MCRDHIALQPGALHRPLRQVPGNQGRQPASQQQDGGLSRPATPFDRPWDASGGFLGREPILILSARWAAPARSRR